MVTVTGFWVLFDEYLVTDDTYVRNMLYAFFGLLLLFLTGPETVVANLSLETDEDEEDSVIPKAPQEDHLLTPLNSDM